MKRTIGAILLLIALLLGVLYACDPLDLLGADDPAPRLPPADQAASPTVDPPKDHTAPFRTHVMVDRNREPDWYSRLSKVTFADGALVAETTYPADWKDATAAGRPVESICGQLFAYAQRGAHLTWTTITVRAVDGTPLVVREGPAGSCRPR